MATVDGLTKGRMLAIEAASVVSGAVDPGTGHLILTKHDGTQIDAGYVWGTIGYATQTVAGIVELADSSEVAIGTNSSRAVTPNDLSTVTAGKLSKSSNLSDVASVSAARTNLNVPQRQVIDVRDYGATGNGTADDTTAIQNAINASSFGDIIHFAPGTYMVTQTIKLLQGRSYRGAGRQFSAVKMMAAANLDAVMASETWLSTTSLAADYPINVYDLKIDANNTAQTGGAGNGIALITFWNTLRNLEVQNCRASGILLTSKRRDGTEVTNTPVENKVFECDIRNTCQTTDVNGGAAICIEDPTSSNQSVTDGYLVNNIIQNTGNAIEIDSAAGWLVQGNHIYGAKGNGIWFNRAGHVRVIANYIENYGTTTVVGTYAAIICGGDTFAELGNTSPNVIVGNTAFYTSGAAATSGIRGLRFEASNGITTRLVVVGNAMFGATHPAGSQGIKLSNQGSTAGLYAQVSGNITYGWDQQYVWTPNGGVLSISGDVFQSAVPTTSTDGFARLPTTAGVPTGVPATQSPGLPMIYDTLNHKLWVYDSAWKGILAGNTPVAVALSAGHAAIDANTGNLFDISATANFTLDNPTNPTNGQVIHLRITQDATGGRTITLGSAWNAGPNTITLSTGANKRDHLIAQYHAGSSKWDITGFQAGY